MQQSIETSELITHRNRIAEKRIDLIISGLKEIEISREKGNIEK